MWLNKRIDILKCITYEWMWEIGCGANKIWSPYMSSRPASCRRWKVIYEIWDFRRDALRI